MSNSDSIYHNLLQRIMFEGEIRKDRTGVGTKGIFGHQMTYYLDKEFPLITTKKLHFKSIKVELLWMLKGYTNIQYLKDNGVSIWDEWADENGELGPVYGGQWRFWTGSNYMKPPIDQIKNLIRDLINDPFSRRHIVSAWNVADIDRMKLPPCHLLFQFHVTNDGKLNCLLFQRSADAFLGVPFNIASYALLVHIIAAFTGLKPGKFVHTIGDAHIYLNHIEQVQLQLSRPTNEFAAPTIKINREGLIDPWDLQPNDIELINYNSHPSIKGDVAV